MVLKVVKDLERYGRSVTPGGNLERAMKNESLQGKSGGLVGMPVTSLLKGQEMTL